MTYIVKHLNNGNAGVYDTILACFPIEGAELRAAGITRLEGTGERGWFSKAETEQAEAIASSLNNYYGYADSVESKVTTLKPVEDEAAFAAAGAALIEAFK